jgi:hypothetical protein
MGLEGILRDFYFRGLLWEIFKKIIEGFLREFTKVFVKGIF